MKSRGITPAEKRLKPVLAALLVAAMSAGAAGAQDSSSSSSDASSSGSTGSSTGGDSSASSGKSAADLEAPNALRGLFTPQPQYPTPGTTIMNPETIPKHLGDDGNQPGRNPGQAGTIYSADWGKHDTTEAETKNKDNPLKGLFTPQPQYPTPGTTIMNPDGIPKHVGDDSSQPGRQPGQAGSVYSADWAKDNSTPSGNKDNVLKDLFVEKPQYPSPNKSVLPPETIPKHLGDDSSQPGRNPGQTQQVFKPTSVPTLEEEAEAAAAAAAKVASMSAEKSEKTDEKDKKDDKEKDKTKDEKDKDKKDEKEKDKDGKKDEKDKEKDEKNKDKKDEDKKDEEKKEDEKKLGEKEKKEKKEGEKTAEEKEKEEKEKKEKEEKEKRLEPKAEAYHPLREAIQLMNERRYPQSHESLTALIKKSPKYAQAYYTRAVVNVMMRKYTEAAADYKEVIKLVPQGELHTLAQKGLNKLHFQTGVE